jgi:hypothetical protein
MDDARSSLAVLRVLTASATIDLWLSRRKKQLSILSFVAHATRGVMAVFDLLIARMEAGKAARRLREKFAQS